MPASVPQVEVPSKVTLRFPLHRQQRIAFYSSATEQLYGGAAGGGKSHWIRVCLIMWCLEIPGLQCYLFRRLYADLVKNHMEGPHSFHVLLAEAVNHGLCTITSHKITFFNGSKIFLNHLQHRKDVTKYHGPEIHVLAFDELTHFEEFQYRFLRSRLRMVGMAGKVPRHLQGKFPRIIAGSNPGSLGHLWVKKMFIGEKMGDLEPLALYEQPKKEGKMLRQFIPARMADNPSLMEDDPDYPDKVEGLGDPVLIRAYKEGNWDIVAGSMFGDVWRPDTEEGEEWHVCTPFMVPESWDRWRGADDGYASPFAGYWLTRDPDTGTVYVTDELYATGLTPEDVRERVDKVEFQMQLIGPRGEELLNRHRLSGTLDSAAFSKTGASTKSRGEQMNDLGLKWEPVEKWPGSRKFRAQELHRLLRPNKKERGLRPGIVFFRNCRNAIATIPAIMRDEDDAEDVSEDSVLHPFDGVTYALQHKKVISRRIKLGGL